MAFDRPHFRDLFYQECDRCLAGFDEAVAGLASDDDEGSAISVAFRMIHTISGNAASVGFDEVTTFSKQLEAFLHDLRSAEESLTGEVLETLAEGRSVLGALIEARKAEEAFDPQTVERATRRLAALRSKIENAG